MDATPPIHHPLNPLLAKPEKPPPPPQNTTTTEKHGRIMYENNT